MSCQYDSIITGAAWPLPKNRTQLLVLPRLQVLQQQGAGGPRALAS